MKKEEEQEQEQEGCEIEAIAICYKIQTHNPKSPFLNIFSTAKPTIRHRHRHLLSDVNCQAKSGEILAIVGPSGAGKSTLLQILAGKTTPHGGSLLLNHHPINPSHFNTMSGYVPQNDTLFPLLTVEETLSFTAKLRLTLPSSDLTAKVTSLIDELGLTHVAHSRIGDDKLRGISGGERRRVSIGVEVIHDPKVLILDEPTSGLDSTSAFQIIDMLKTTMAEARRRTIVLREIALVPNFIVGNSVISGVMGSFFLFSGYFISNHEIPKYWIFMHYISVFKYPFEGFLINEFSRSGKCLEMMFGECVVRGEDVLKEEGYGEESRWRNVMVMMGFVLIYRFVSYVVLRFRCSQKKSGFV
ncbi:ABC transporter G family member 5, partial [Cucurbita argyrosperma subsp. sororia]